MITRQGNRLIISKDVGGPTSMEPLSEADMQVLTDYISDYKKAKREGRGHEYEGTGEDLGVRKPSEEDWDPVAGGEASTVGADDDGA